VAYKCACAGTYGCTYGAAYACTFTATYQGTDSGSESSSASAAYQGAFACVCERRACSLAYQHSAGESHDGCCFENSCFHVSDMLVVNKSLAGMYSRVF
jgi:hypothetical protein